MKRLLIIAALLIEAIVLRAQDYSFVNYGIKEGLPSTQVYDVMVDGKGYVWFTSDGGISRFDGKDFENFAHADGLASLINMRFHPTSDSTFWVNGVTGGLSYWDGQKFSAFTHNGRFDPYRQGGATWPTILKVDEEAVYFCRDVLKSGCPDSVYRIEILSGTVNSVLLRAFDASLTSVSNQTEFQFRNCALFAQGKYGGVDRMVADPSSKASTSAFVDSQGNYWIGTYNGLKVFDDSGKIIGSGLAEQTVSAFYETADRGLWVCTLDNGVYHLPNSAIRTNSLAHLSGYRDIFRLKVDTGLLYVRTEGRKLLKIFPSTGTVVEMSVKGAISSDRRESYGALFQEQRISKEQVVRWTTTFFSLVDTKEDSSKVHEGRVLDCLLSSDDHVWIGTPECLYANDLSDSTSSFEKVEIPWLDGSVHIRKMEEALDGIWIATASHGLIFYNRKDFIRIQDPGIFTERINSVLPVGDTVLWAASDVGLYKISYRVGQGVPALSSVRLYNTSSGLISDQIVDVKLLGNELYVASLNGICHFFPADLQCNKAPGTVTIREIRSNGTVVPDLASIEHTGNNITISFQGVSTQRLPKGVHDFRYRMGDSRWVTTDQVSVVFNDLRSGWHEIEVQFRGLSRKWSDPAIRKFYITPHFSETSWFQLLTVLVISGFVILLFKWRVRQVRKRAELENTIQKIELSNLRNQVNPHFIFNSLNTLQNFIFDDNAEKANIFLGAFSKVIRKGLEYTKEETISVREEIEFLKHYISLEKERFKDRFDAHIEVIGDSSLLDLQIPPLLTQPLVENAIRHAFSDLQELGSLYIYFERFDQTTIKIRVVDNGRGFTKRSGQNDGHRSVGLSMIEDRIMILSKKHKNRNGGMLIDSQVNKGTTVTLLIPCNFQTSNMHVALDHTNSQ